MVGKPYRETEVTLKNILSKHDTLDGNRLSLEGFLSYYREVAATDPRQVSWFESSEIGKMDVFELSLERRTKGVARV